MYYFAYGSNMNLEHMRRLCGWHFRVLGIGKLNDYDFGPDTRGFATIVEKVGKTVLGVIYEIDEQCLDILDNFEGFPDVFGRSEVTVTDNMEKVYKAWVYIEPIEMYGGDEIRVEYMRRVLSGAIENHLPEQWIAFLKSFKIRDK